MGAAERCRAPVGRGHHVVADGARAPAGATAGHLRASPGLTPLWLLLATRPRTPLPCHDSGWLDMIVFTVCPRIMIAYALTLHEALARHHRGSPLLRRAIGRRRGLGHDDPAVRSPAPIRAGSSGSGGDGDQLQRSRVPSCDQAVRVPGALRSSPGRRCPVPRPGHVCRQPVRGTLGPGLRRCRVCAGSRHHGTGRACRDRRRPIPALWGLRPRLLLVGRSPGGSSSGLVVGPSP